MICWFQQEVFCCFQSLLAPSSSLFFIRQIRQAMSVRKLGVDIALREPRLLLYDINESLAPKVSIFRRGFAASPVSPFTSLSHLSISTKAQMWKARVNDAESFTSLLARYPTLLMYSLGAAARLEYFAYRNRRKPDASEARQLLMLSKKAVEAWGKHSGCLFDSTPAILDGIVSRRGRPRNGESALEASKRRVARRAAQPCSPQQLEELKIGTLRKLLKDNGGTPSSKRKSHLISELRALGFDAARSSEPNLRPHKRNDGSSHIDAQCFLSYPRWISMKLSTSYPLFLENNDDVDGVSRRVCRVVQYFLAWSFFWD